MVFEEKIKKKIEQYRPQATATLSELIGFRTVNPPGRFYRECADYLCGKLKSWGFAHRLVAVAGKYPRFSILGFHGQGKKSLHFHGHYDVVPEFSPGQFVPRLKGDRLYGRGSSDMKGGLVAMLFALRAIKECGLELSGQITFSLVPDEETGGRLGTQHLFDLKLLAKPSLGMLMPEPTGRAIWNANKGALTYRIEIKGKSAHVGLEHEGVNAFERMAEVVHSLLKLKRTIQKRRTTLTVKPAEAKSSVMLIGGESGSGVSFNIVPDKAFFTIDRRINPEESLHEAKMELMAALEEQKKRGIAMKVKIVQEGESSAADPKTPLAEALRQSVIEVTGKEPCFELCPGLCEIRYFNNRKIPAFACGPGLLEVAHGKEEYVLMSDVLNCAEIYARTAVRLLT